jgi:hypothetical protein
MITESWFGSLARECSRILFLAGLAGSASEPEEVQMNKRT